MKVVESTTRVRSNRVRWGKNETGQSSENNYEHMETMTATEETHTISRNQAQNGGCIYKWNLGTWRNQSICSILHGHQASTICRRRSLLEHLKVSLKC